MEPKHAASAHRLQNTYAFWVQKKNKRTAGATWSSGMQQIARFNTVESFWQVSMLPTIRSALVTKLNVFIV